MLEPFRTVRRQQEVLPGLPQELDKVAIVTGGNVDEPRMRRCDVGVDRALHEEAQLLVDPVVRCLIGVGGAAMVAMVMVVAAMVVAMVVMF